MKKIERMSTEITGIFAVDQKWIDAVKVGDPLLLIREPTNPHDKNAIRACNKLGQPLGYIPGELAQSLARYMDSGNPIIECKITKILQEYGQKVIKILIRKKAEKIKKKPEKNVEKIDTKRIKDFFENIEIGKKESFKNLTIFPLFTEKAKAFDYVTLDEAIKNKWMEITEVSESGTVPELRVRNKSHKNVIIVDGEELVGAKQNRIINITVIIIAHSETIIPVTCTEAGRWSYRGKRFSSGVQAYTALRRAKTENVVYAMERGEYHTDQSSVWQEIDRKMLSMETESSTREMRKIYIDRKKDLKNYEKSLPPIKGANGIVVAINGKIVCADIFDQSRAMSKIWKKLINSCSMDAIEKVQKKIKEPTAKDIKSFLKKVRDGNIKTQKSIGEGRNISIKRKDIVASGLACDNKVVHLSIFPK